MPLYDYKCEKCGNKFERLFSLKEYNKRPSCPKCGGLGRKILTLGGIQDDHPVWLDGSIIRQLQDTDDPNTRFIESRTEYNQYLKDNDIQPSC